MAHCVHVVLQVTFPVVGQNDAAQLAVAGEVEARIGGEHQQTGHVPPADLFLGNEAGNTLTAHNNILPL